MLGKEARLETGKEERCWGRRQGWDQTGRVGRQHGQVGKSDVVGSGDGKGLETRESVFQEARRKRGSLWSFSCEAENECW